ncbi:MAG: CYTH domain-containing protein [Clostridiales bacterium]|nr:CYTH domain-containing protein [Clostridiales bacterium]
MEIELKYNIPTDKIAEEIWNNKLFSQLEERNSREELCLDAKYFDTENCDLAKEEIAYRIRKEGGKWVATLKWKGHSEGALHTREEINVPVENDDSKPEVFSESEIGRQVVEILGDRKLTCVLEMKFTRKRLRLDTGDGLFELSIDQGDILTQYGNEPISEVEIELFSGEADKLVSLGEKLSKKYSLETEERSKYARGIKLIKDNR